MTPCNNRLTGRIETRLEVQTISALVNVNLTIARNFIRHARHTCKKLEKQSYYGASILAGSTNYIQHETTNATDVNRRPIDNRDCAQETRRDNTWIRPRIEIYFGQEEKRAENHDNQNRLSRLRAVCSRRYAKLQTRVAKNDTNQTPYTIAIETCAYQTKRMLSWRDFVITLPILHYWHYCSHYAHSAFWQITCEMCISRHARRSYY